MNYYDRQQAAITAEIERLCQERPGPDLTTDEQWHTFLRNRARLAELDERRNPPNE